MFLKLPLKREVCHSKISAFVIMHCCFFTSPPLSFSLILLWKLRERNNAEQEKLPLHSIFWLTVIVRQERPSKVIWRHLFSLWTLISSGTTFSPCTLVSECLRPNTQQHTRSHLTLWPSWHKSGWQRTHQTLILQGCVWGHRRLRQGCCVRHHTASWQGAPFSQQCSVRSAALWNGFTMRELRSVGTTLFHMFGYSIYWGFNHLRHCYFYP